jgi:hypothetical protein
MFRLEPSTVKMPFSVTAAAFGHIAMVLAESRGGSLFAALKYNLI